MNPVRSFRKQGIFEASALLGLFRAISMLLGLTMYLLLAAKFGASGGTDAFLIAQSVQLFIFFLVEGSLSSTFVPVFIDYREKHGEEEAWTIASTAFCIVAALFTALSLLIAAAAPLLAFILAPGFSSSVSAITSKLIIFLSPLVLLRCMSAFSSALYFSYQRFTLPAVLSMMPSLGAVASLLWLSDRFGIYALPLGMVAMSAVQAAGLLLPMCFGGRLFNKVSLRHPGLREFGLIIGPRILNLALTRVDAFAARFFASFLGTGAVTALTYAHKIILFVPTLTLAPANKVILPILSRHSALGDLSKVRMLLTKALSVAWFVAAPIFIMVFLFGNQLVDFALHRGTYDQDAVGMTVSALIFYNIGLFSFCTAVILRHGFLAMKDTVTPLRLAACASVLNIVADVVLMKLMGLGGLALATSIVATFNAVLLFFLLRRKLSTLDGKGAVLSFSKVLLSGFCMWIVLFGIIRFRAHDLLPLEPLHQVALLILAGGLIYLGFCRLFAVPGYEYLMKPLKQKLLGRES